MAMAMAVRTSGTMLQCYISMPMFMSMDNTCTYTYTCMSTCACVHVHVHMRMHGHACASSDGSASAHLHPPCRIDQHDVVAHLLGVLDAIGGDSGGVAAVPLLEDRELLARASIRRPLGPRQASSS